MVFFAVQRFIMFHNRSGNMITLEKERTDFEALGEVVLKDEFMFVIQLTTANFGPLDISEGSEFRKHFRFVTHETELDYKNSKSVSDLFRSRDYEVELCTEDYFARHGYQ